MSETPHQTGARHWGAVALTALACLASTALTAPQAPAAAPSERTAVRAAAVGAAAPTLTRAQVPERAKTWLTANSGRPVPYAQDKYWKDGHRQDCSGCVSMALGLWKPGPNTVSLKKADHTRPIAMSDLAPGDLVIKADSDNPNQRHVVVFDGWADGARTAYKSFEQAGGVGTRWKQHSCGVSGGDGHHAYRPVNIVD
ncbi:hypothetical protein [Streptomyces sp. DH12]|uniref:hypothetical protein n=1 Tax=Streptomyces sp. DH12 TaxID=2857010 RepID=UPI001E457848|nr:hypothetical protein [Streptomyces sp. DH12]